MASIAFSRTNPRRFPGSGLAFALVVAAGAFLAGVALAKLGSLTGASGPVVMAALPVVVLLSIAILAVPWLAVAVFYATFPVAFAAVPFFASFEVKLIELVVLYAAGLLVMRRLGTGLSPLPWAPQMWWAVLILGWAVVATPAAPSLADAIKQDVDILLGILLALAVVAGCRSMEELRKGLGMLLAASAVLAADGLRHISDIHPVAGAAFVLHRPKGVFAQPNDLGAFTAAVLMVAIGATLGSRRRSTRLLAAGVGALSLVTLAFSLSRGAWLGTALAGLTLLIVLPQARRAVFAVVIPALIVAAVLLAVFLPSGSPQVKVVEQRLGTLTNPFSNPYDSRPVIWREALREIGQRPLTGEGPGSFPIASARAASLAQTVQADHAHDVLLTVAAETGVPNALLLIGFTIAIGLVAFRAARRLPNARDRAMVAGVAAGLMTQVGQGIVDFNLRNPLIALLMWSLVGMVLVARRELLSAPAPPETVEVEEP